MSANNVELKWGLWTPEKHVRHLEGLMNLLKCPGCKTLIDPSFVPKQCQKGHFVCGPCCTRLPDVCPSPKCGQRFLKKPVPQLLIDLLVFIPKPCEHEGCSLVVPLQDQVNHRTECDFRPFSCPVCDRPVGALKNNNFTMHLKEEHKNSFYENKRLHFLLKKTPTLQKNISVLFAFGQYFVIKLEPVALTLIKSKFSYLIKINSVQIEGGFIEQQYYCNCVVFDHNDKVLTSIWGTLTKNESHYKGLRSCFCDTLIIQGSFLDLIPTNSNFKIRVSISDRYPHQEYQAMGVFSPAYVPQTPLQLQNDEPRAKRRK